MKAKLHHLAYCIAPDSTGLVLELLERLGCTLAYNEGNARWCMVEQKPIPINIQMIEAKGQPIPIEEKTNAHIAFLSDAPKEDIEGIKRWAEGKGVKFRQGSWSDKELWFDLPDVFVNFVIEIMHTSVIG